MFPYKFTHHSQKNDSGLVNGVFSKRSNLDTVQNASQSRDAPKMGFDFSLPLPSRRVEPHAGTSPYPRHASESTDPNIPAAGTSFRVKDELDIIINPLALPTPTLSSADFPKKFVKANAQEHDPRSPADNLPEDYLDSMTAKFRQLRKEGVEQRVRITDLESRLAAKNEENFTLSRNLARVETVYKQEMDKQRDALDRTAKSHSALKSELDNLKRFSESSSLIVSEAKAAKESFASLRDDIHIRLQELESKLDNNGQLILTAESRETVHELRSELLKTQQVADLLRDKLHSMGTELANAQARVVELEELVVADRNRANSTSVQIRQSADQAAEVMRYLQEQKHESLQATVKVYEMEQQLLHTQTDLQKAQSMITSMKEEMTAREEFQEEQGAKLRTLRNTIEFQDGNVRAFEARVQTAEEELTKALSHNHELQGRLDSAKDLEKNLMEQVSRLLLERDDTSEKLKSVERELGEMRIQQTALSSDIEKTTMERSMLADKLKSLEDAKREADMCRERCNEVRVSLKVLQERFDDQSVTLAASKESIGELQERLHAAERCTIETSNASKHEITRLREENGVLKARLDRADKAVEDRRISSQAFQIELAHKEGTFQALLETERSSKNEALNQVREAKTKIDSLLAELALRDLNAQDLTERLSAAQVPTREREQEVAALKVRIAELETTERRLTDRAATISRRYENNDLNDDERGLVALLTQKARAVHDRETVEKTNEIKRRDNIIKQHEARIAQLEKVLARRIYDESWATSAKSTDEPSNSMADGIQPHGPSSDHQPESRGAGHEGFSTTATHTTASGATANPAIVPAPSSRSTGYTSFSILCREDTDDIADFAGENPPAATGKRVMFSDEVEGEASRPARRVKHGKATTTEHTVDDQTALPASGANSKKKAGKRR